MSETPSGPEPVDGGPPWFYVAEFDLTDLTDLAAEVEPENTGEPVADDERTTT